MSVLKIIQLSNESIYTKETTLRQKSEPVIDFGEVFQKQVDDLLDTFYNWKIAVGISGPQVGIQKRIAIVNLDKTKKENTLILVNPEIISESGKKDIKKESCLSIPNFRGDVERRHKLQFTYQDRYGIKKQLNTESFYARVIMHEIDHLNGVLFVDRMSQDKNLEPYDMKWE